MSKSAHTGSGLTGLIVLILVIVVTTVCVTALCTGICTGGSCLSRGCSARESSVTPGSAGETAQVPTRSATQEPIAVVTPEPTPTPAPTPTPSPTPTPEPLPVIDEPVPTREPVEAAAVPREKLVRPKNDGTDTVTVLILMNGSELESKYGEATDDLNEILAAVRRTDGDRVKIVIETVGTKSWQTEGIAADRAQRFLVTKTGLMLIDDSLGQLDTTVPSTLSGFIRWGTETYPADRYILLFWNHGGGPVYGFGYDEYRSVADALTLDEIRTALRDGGTVFDWIGMDCCLMSSLEVASALYDYCDYTVLSEDFEPGCGWAYTEWLAALLTDPAIDTAALCRVLIDSSVTDCRKQSKKAMTLALIDEAHVPLLFSAWTDFAYANEATLLSANYSQFRESNGGRVHPRLARAVGGTVESAAMGDYCITDLLSLADNIPSAQSEPLADVLNDAVAYFGVSTGKTTLAGLSVTLPYNDRPFYNALKRVFYGAGVDQGYIDWLEKFVDADIPEDEYFDFSDWHAWASYFASYDWSDWRETLHSLGEIADDLIEAIRDEGITFDDLFDYLFSY
jgi:hypothetical protein